MALDSSCCFWMPGQPVINLLLFMISSGMRQPTWKCNWDMSRLGVGWSPLGNMPLWISGLASAKSPGKVGRGNYCHPRVIEGSQKLCITDKADMSPSRWSWDDWVPLLHSTIPVWSNGFCCWVGYRVPDSISFGDFNLLPVTWVWDSSGIDELHSSHKPIPNDEIYWQLHYLSEEVTMSFGSEGHL